MDRGDWGTPKVADRSGMGEPLRSATWLFAGHTIG
jgi:hypothetical protein